MDYKCDKEQFLICKNNNKCHLCDGVRLFKKQDYLVRKEKEQLKRQQKKDINYKRKPKEGMAFEKRVVKRINQHSAEKPTARRRPNSGAFWNMPGDIVTATDLLECKERGSVTSRGEKSFTIQKDWLDKVRAESILAKKDWALPFTFKGTQDIYVIKSFEDELAMRQELDYLREEVKKYGDSERRQE